MFMIIATAVAEASMAGLLLWAVASERGLSLSWPPVRLGRSRRSTWPEVMAGAR